MTADAARRMPRSTIATASGRSRASARPPAKSARYATVRFADSHDRSGATDHMIERAQSNASAANRSSVSPPSSRPAGARRIATATSAPPATTAPISSQVTLDSSKPLPPANAMAARPAPISALAAKDAKRDTARLRPAMAQHERSGERGRGRQDDQGDQQRSRKGVRRGNDG